jgi:hypothetical protein
MLIECQQELNKADNKAYQNVKDKKELDVHQNLVKIPNPEKTRLYLSMVLGHMTRLMVCVPFVAMDTWMCSTRV